MEKSCLLCYIRAAFYSALRYFLLMFQYKIKCLCLDILISSLGLATKVLAQPFIDRAVFKICVSFKVKLYPLGFHIEPQYF